MKALTRQWLEKAESDMTIARRLLKDEPDETDGICFHCQPAAEKFLKAMIQELGMTIPRTHDLNKLVTLLAPSISGLSALRPKLIRLTHFAVDYRYPGKSATATQAKRSWNSALLTQKFTYVWLAPKPKPRRKGHKP